MDLKQYLSELTPEQRQDLAERAGTSPAYLVQLAGAHRKPSPAMARALVEASNNKLSLENLRPDIWGEVA